MNSDRLVQLKVIKEIMLDHLDALRREEVKLFGLAFKVGALDKIGMNPRVKEELDNVAEANKKLRNELMFYMNNRIEAEENNNEN